MSTPASAPAAGQTLPAGWEVKTSSSTGATYYVNTATGESTWDFPTKPEEGVPPESAAERAAKIIVAKSNAGFEEGESARAQIQSELTQLDDAVESTAAAASAATAGLETAKAAADAAVEEARAAGVAEEVLEAKVAAVLAASAKATSASNTALQTAEEVKKSIKILRKAVNGTSGDLATSNAQLRKENEALVELLGDKLSGNLDLSGKKTLSSKSAASPTPSTAPPASPAGTRRATTPERGSKGDYNARRAELLKARREFEQQKAAAEAASKEKWTGAPKSKKVSMDDPAAVRLATVPIRLWFCSSVCVAAHSHKNTTGSAGGCRQVKAEAVRREAERAKRLQEEADRKAELQKVCILYRLPVRVRLRAPRCVLV